MTLVAVLREMNEWEVLRVETEVARVPISRASLRGLNYADDLIRLVEAEELKPEEERFLARRTLSPRVKWEQFLEEGSPWTEWILSATPPNRRSLLLLASVLGPDPGNREAVARLCSRLGRPPFDGVGNGALVWKFFLGLEPEHRNAFLEAPNPCLKHCETYCRDQPRSEKVLQGLERMRVFGEGLVVDWLVHCPHRMVRSAFWLGSLAEEKAESLLKELRYEALYLLDPLEDPLLQTAEILMEEGHISQDMVDYVQADKIPPPAIESRLRDSLRRRQRSLQLERLQADSLATLNSQL